MSKIYITPTEDLFDVIDKVMREDSSEIELMIDTKNPILSNSLNLKYIESEATKESKAIIFVPKDDEGKEKLGMYYDQDIDLNVNVEAGASEVYQASASKDDVASGFVSGDILEHEEKKDKKPKLKKLNFKFPKINLNAKGMNKLFVYLTGFFLLIIPIGLFLVWWYLPSADVKLVLKSENLTQAITLTASPEVTEANITEGVLPAKLISAQQSLSNQVLTTGSKEIGEKAMGSVTISNKIDEEISLSSGTIIEAILSSSADILRYVTLEPVTVPAKEGSTSGSAEVSVEAVEIGGDFNIGSNKLFQVGDLDSTDIVAENTDGFSGGDSRVVKVVDQTDADELLAGSMVTLEKTVREELNNNAKDMNLASNSVKVSVIEEAFSNEVGAEADNLSLNLILRAEGLVIDEQVVKGLEDQIKPNIPDGFAEIEGSKTFKFDVIDSQEFPKVIIEYSSKIGKGIDTNKISNDLKGAKTSVAQDYLKNLEGVLEYAIRLKPKLPDFLTKMPRSANKIDVQVEYR